MIYRALVLATTALFIYIYIHTYVYIDTYTWLCILLQSNKTSWSQEFRSVKSSHSPKETKVPMWYHRANTKLIHFLCFRNMHIFAAPKSNIKITWKKTAPALKNPHNLWGWLSTRICHGWSWKVSYEITKTIHIYIYVDIWYKIFFPTTTTWGNEKINAPGLSRDVYF